MGECLVVLWWFGTVMVILGMLLGFWVSCPDRPWIDTDVIGDCGLWLWLLVLVLFGVLVWCLGIV